ncbi:MAG: hypothetical protein QXQ53_01320 [Candidatus Methanosuratincola sp.]
MTRATTKVMMRCGHVALATDGEGRPICPMCVGIVEGATEVAEVPSLVGRKARCTACGREVDSDLNLPFFGYRKEEKEDEWYCGCKGWE